MEITHALYSLISWYQKIETSHSSSQEEEEEEEEEDKRNWVELPPDVTSLIFLKLGTVDILDSVQWVCSSWWKLSKQPHLFRSIHVSQVLTSYGPSFFSYNSIYSKKLAIEAIDRSCGQLVEFSVKSIATDRLLHYMSQRSSSLRCLRFVSCRVAPVGESKFIEMVKKLPQLEELEIVHCLVMPMKVLEAFGCFCPRLKSCRLNYVNCSSRYRFSGGLQAIAQNMPELRYLSLFGSNLLTDDGLKTVLDGCPHLKSLDLRQCYGLEFAGDLKERCGNIEVIRLPNDPTDDFEYEQVFHPAVVHSEYDYLDLQILGIDISDDDDYYDNDYEHFGMYDED